jgi:hypothetical protein
MARVVYRYAFNPGLPREDIEAALVLAVFGAESLHGEAEVRLDAGYFLDPGQHICVVDATTDVGRDFNRLFIGFLGREHGDDGFTVERLEGARPEKTQQVAA